MMDSKVSISRLVPMVVASYRCGLLAALNQDARSAEEHASLLGLDPFAIQQLLDALAQSGYCYRDERGRYARLPTADDLSTILAVTVPRSVSARGEGLARSGVRIRHHAYDDSIFIDDEYLIKGLSGRILLYVLTVYERDGRTELTTRELRAEGSLSSRSYRDNLDARLVLLRRRLEERTAALKLVKAGRGRLRLQLSAPFELVRAG